MKKSRHDHQVDWSWREIRPGDLISILVDVPVWDTLEGPCGMSNFRLVRKGSTAVWLGTGAGDDEETMDESTLIRIFLYSDAPCQLTLSAIRMRKTFRLISRFGSAEH